MKYFSPIYQVVRKIPAGKVTTYGEISKIVPVNPRVVGWALNANKDPSVPCHRVVSKNGSLAPNYVFGGLEVQRKKLLEEAVSFIDETHVDIKNFIFSFGEEASKLVKSATR